MLRPSHVVSLQHSRVQGLVSDRRAEGRRSEDRAAEFLLARGYELVERNFTSRYGEIDLVCRDGDTLVFVEVKMRRPSSYGTAEEAVSPAKQRRLINAAEDYLQRTGDSETPARFDVVAMGRPARGEDASIRLIRNAIET